MSHPTPTRSRRRTGLGAAAVTVVLATSLAACGSDDDKTTSTSASTPTTTAATTTTTGGASGTTTQAGGTTSGGGTAGGGAPSGAGVGKAPAANEGAIRAALKRSPEATKAAGTARYTTTQTVFGVKTSGTGTIDTATQTVLIEQRIQGAGSAGGTVQVYGEKGKIYIRQGSGPWQVTDSPIAVGDPLSQLKLLDKAKITKIGGTKTYDGKTCREFTASLGFKDALESIGAAQAKQLLKAVPGNASIPSTSCIDDAGLSYATSSSYDIKKILGDAVPSGLPGGESSQDIRITEYGTAPKPERPAGIDDAKPLGAGAGSGSSSLTQ
ncbi:hypothetical protein [Patulibacter minatonensis]|uniref:hypothetical protein n=1 Tax=Patulibacter minatonensis TaxID=298163 RepID=UPI0006862953|nr:hypothetical protein [Patulibacter minatonensis]